MFDPTLLWNRCHTNVWKNSSASQRVCWPHCPPSIDPKWLKNIAELPRFCANCSPWERSLLLHTAFIWPLPCSILIAVATAPPSPVIGLTRHNQNLPATKRHACQEHGASPTIFPVKIAMNILLKWLCQRILAVFGTDHCFDKIRLAKRFEIWFRGGCVASVANIRELYKCSSIFGHKNVGWQPKLLCGCGCMFRLGHRIPPGRAAHGHFGVYEVLLRIAMECFDTWWGQFFLATRNALSKHASLFNKYVLFRTHFCLQHSLGAGQIKTQIPWLLSVKWKLFLWTFPHAWNTASWDKGPVHIPYFAACWERAPQDPCIH